MAHNYSTESTALPHSEDSPMNRAMLITSMDSLSDALCDDLNNPSCPVARAKSVIAGTDINAAQSSLENTCAGLNNDLDAEELLDGSTDTAKRSMTLLNLTDSRYMISAHSVDGSDASCCESFVESMNSSIQSSNIWPALNVLRKRLSDENAEEDAEKQDNGIMKDLLEMFEYDPQNFTQHLCTIIEEESGDFSMPEMATNSVSQPSVSVHSDSTQYMSFKRYGRNGTTVGNLFTSPKDGETMCIANTPTIVVIPSTPKPLRRDDNLESPKDCIEDDDYVTAESEVDEDFEDPTILDRDKSTTETINLTKVVRHHEEWVETFERVRNYEPSKKPTASSAIVNRSERFKIHRNKLEIRWMRELTKKRQKCFDTINDLLAKAAAQRSEDVADESVQCMCERCKRQMELYTTLVAASDFYAHACKKRDSRSDARPTVPKKNRRSFSRSPAKSRRDNVTNSREVLTKNGTRKSLSKKTKSPGGRYKSPRRGVVVTAGVKKSPAIATRRNAKATTNIDDSSIRPVSQLRQIFSPRFKLSGPMESKMAGSSRMPIRTYTLKTVETISGARPSPRNQCASNFISPAHKAKFKHVKSPVADYIKGNKI